MKIYLFRHGETEHSWETRVIGQTDVPLNDTGRAQAQWWCKALVPHAFQRIYCSDLVRSRETAEILANNGSAALTVLPLLREINLGQWDGLTQQEVKATFPGEWSNRGQDIAAYRPAGGESFADLAARVLPALETITRDGEDIIAIAGHAGVNRVILCHMLGMPFHHLFRIGQDYGALNIIEWKGNVRKVLAMNLKPPLNAVSSTESLPQTETLTHTPCL